MSFRAELILEGKTFKVLKCEYNFSQELNTLGKPVSRVFSAPIKIILQGTTEDETILSWAVNSKKEMEGAITFYKRDLQTKIKEIKFERGFCIRYKESTEMNKGLKPVSITTQILEIAVGKLSIEGVTHDNYWG